MRDLTAEYIQEKCKVGLDSLILDSKADSFCLIPVCGTPQTLRPALLAIPSNLVHYQMKEMTTAESEVTHLTVP